MKAIRYHRYGGPDVLILDELALPEPGPGQLRVRINAASVNPIDWKLREGFFKDFMPLKLPITTGSDFSGIVDAVGSEATGSDLGWSVGTAVFGMLAAGDKGTCAEYVLVEPQEIAMKPRSLSFAEAAALPMGALTAWMALVDAAAVKTGERVFIHAAAGNVGNIAVQIAKARGAHVIGAARAGGRAAVLAAGADEFVDYDQGPFEQVTVGADVVLDTLAGDMQTRSLALLSRGGRLVSTLGVVDEAEARRRGIAAFGIAAVPNGARLHEIAELVEAGLIRVHVAQQFALANTAEAQALSQSGAPPASSSSPSLPTAVSREPPTSQSNRNTDYEIPCIRGPGRGANHYPARCRGR